MKINRKKIGVEEDKANCAGELNGRSSGCSAVVAPHSKMHRPFRRMLNRSLVELSAPMTFPPPANLFAFHAMLR